MALAYAYPTPGTKLNTMTEWENLFARTTVDGIITGYQ
jgi:hypothetical protein